MRRAWEPDPHHSRGGSHAANPSGAGGMTRITAEAAPTPPVHRGSAMTRTPRPIIPGATYFVTSVTHDRHQWFTNPQFARIVVDQWKHYEQAYGFHLDTYSVMPDHYHVVLHVGERKTVSQVLHAVNSYIVTLISQQLGQTLKSKIWEGNPWDEVIRNEEMYWQKVAYILFNPWRDGLVNDPLSPYPFSDIADWLEREGEEFMLDLFSRYKRWTE
jgi:putative transposase